MIGASALASVAPLYLSFGACRSPPLSDTWCRGGRVPGDHAMRHARDALLWLKIIYTYQA